MKRPEMTVFILLSVVLATSAFAVNHPTGNRASHPYEFVRTGNRRVNDVGSKVPQPQNQFGGLKSPIGGEKPPSKKNGVPPYAVLMEPLVKYSQPDPLYDKSKEPNSAASTPVPKSDLKVKREDTKTDGQNQKLISSKSSYEDQEGEATNFHKFQKQRPQIAYAVPGFLYETLPTEPEPIIEIIIKESNQSLPTPPPPPPPPPKKKKKEQVQVFYVKYKKDPSSHYGEEKIIYDPPVPAVTPSTNNADHHEHEEEEEELYYQHHQHHQHHEEDVTLPPKPSTTLKAIIKPDSEVYHSTGNVHISFGGPHHDEEDDHHSHHHHHHHRGDFEEQSAPQPSILLPPKRKTSALSRTSSESQLTKRNPAPFHSQTQPPQQTFQGPSVSPPREFQHSTPLPTFQQTPQFPAQSFKPQATKIHPSHPPPSPTPPRPSPTRYSTLPQHLQQFPKPQQTFSFPPQPQPQPRPHPPLQPVQQSTLQTQQYYSINQPHLKSTFQVNVPRRASQQYQTISSQAAAQQHGFPERQPQNLQIPSFHQPPKPFPQPTHAPIPQPSHVHLPQAPHPHIPQQPQPHIPHQPQPHIPHQPQPHIPQQPQPHIPQQPQPHIPQQSHPQFPQPQNSFPQQSSTFSQVPSHSVGPIIQRTQAPGLPLQNGFVNKPPVPPPQQHQFQHHPNPSFQHQQQIEQLNRLQQQQQRLQTQILDQQKQNFFNQQKFQTTPAPEIIRSVSPDLSFGSHRFETKKPQTVPHHTPRPQFLQTVKSGAQYSSKNVHPTTESFKHHTTQQAVEYVTEDPKKVEEEKRKKEEKKKQNVAALPKEVPDDLREQLLSSGILGNADIQILDYDKIGDIPIESLPPEALANFQAVAGSNPVPSVVKAPSSSDDAVAEGSEVNGVAVPPNTPSDIMEMKVVRYNPDSKEGAQIPNKYVKDDATQLEPVVLNDSKYNRYLPLKVSGAQFPVPDVPELRGKDVTSVVVLAPVDYEFLQKHEEVEEDARAGRRSSHHVLEVQGVHFVAGDVLKTLVKRPTAENYRKWLDKENSTALDKQSVVLLVIEPKHNATSPEKEIFMYDIGTQKVSKLSGELSAQFVEVAESNSENDDLEEISDSTGGSFTLKDAAEVSPSAHIRRQRKAIVAKTGSIKSKISPR